jgi:hypothetical protein
LFTVFHNYVSIPGQCRMKLILDRVCEDFRKLRWYANHTGYQLPHEIARSRYLKEKFGIPCICPECIEQYQYYNQVALPTGIQARITSIPNL